MYIETKISLKNNSIYTALKNEDLWAIFSPKKHSLDYKISDIPKEGALCTKIQKGRILVPIILIMKYGLDKPVNLWKMSDSEYSIRSECLGAVPKMSNAIKYLDDSVYEGTIEKEWTETVIGGGTLTVNRASHSVISLKNACVKIHMGDHKYIEISNDGCTHEISGVKEIFGDRFFGFSAEYVEYRNPNVSPYQFSLISCCKKAWGLNVGDSVRMLKMTDGRLIITPIPKTDEITGEKILPEIEPVKEILMCEDCDDSDVVKELIRELKKMQELVVSYNEINKDLQEKLEAQSKENCETKTRLSQIEALLKR